jgi:serine/threonine protein kinase
MATRTTKRSSSVGRGGKKYTLPTDSGFGQFTVLRPLGRGGMGEVYEVQHRVLHTRYAMKLLPMDFALRDDALKRFQDEARVMANLQHPHIVKVDDFGQTDGTYWLRMELIKGLEDGIISLDDYARRHQGKVDQTVFASLLEQILEALACAHRRGVVHRDIKPGNILLESGAGGQLVAKVADFGIAKVMGEEWVRTRAELSVTATVGHVPTLLTSRGSRDGANNSRGRTIGGTRTKLEGRETETYALLGTYEYMAPEQKRGEKADARSDIFAVGLICYRLLTGQDISLKLPSKIDRKLSPLWDDLIARALESAAPDRFAHGQEMLEAYRGLGLLESLGLRPISEIAAVSEKPKAPGPNHVPVDPKVKMLEEELRVMTAERKSAEEQARQAAEARARWQMEARRLTEEKKTAEESARRMAEEHIKLRESRQKTGVYRSLRGQGGRRINVTLATIEQPFINSLDMRFVPVAGTRALFSIWLARVQDYAVFAQATGREWPKPKFTQSVDHPAIMVSWEDAQSFCEWLTERERGLEHMAHGLRYRLPTDEEWSVAVGLPHEVGNAPRDKSGVINYLYPWGTQWPPTKGAGNYADVAAHDKYPHLGLIDGYKDGFADTSPVGSFDANLHGLLDMGGNVWEWCEDSYEPGRMEKVLRGGSFVNFAPQYLLSSNRDFNHPGFRYVNIGFRVVLGDLE